jgi:hypothetical protein
MFGCRRLIVTCLICLACFTACVSTTPPAPSPVHPTPTPLHGYHITLYDQNGHMTHQYDIGPNDIIRDDPIHQNIWFRVGGQEQRFHGSFQKERY